MVITIDNIRALQKHESVVHRVRVTGNKYYKLLKALDIKLRDGTLINIPVGFEWDLSSVPRFLWSIFPPDGDFELAALIHDYLYRNKIKSRKFADEEMFAWSKAVAGTSGRKAWSDIDNWIRYATVRILGWTVWNKR